jgi:hypothetical protein
VFFFLQSILRFAKLPDKFIMYGDRMIRKERDIGAAKKEEDKKKREEAKAAAASRMQAKLDAKKGAGKGSGKGKAGK